MREYWLGTGDVSWLGEHPLRPDVNICVSRSRLTRTNTWPRAARDWIADSSGYSVLSADVNGSLRRPDGWVTWPITPHQWANDVRRYADEIGRLRHAAPLDWMTEGPVRSRTGLSRLEHQRRTVYGYLELRSLDDSLPWMPVLQGDPDQGPDGHLWCADEYARAGVDLAAEPLVGVGSVCRIQRSDAIVDLAAALHREFGGAVRLHGFGVSLDGIRRTAPAWHSGDTQAWSRDGRHSGPCRHGLPHQTEANCPTHAQAYLARVWDAAATMTPERWEETAARREAVRGTYQQDALLPVASAPSRWEPSWGQQLSRATRVFRPPSPADPDAVQVGAVLDRARAAFAGITAPGPAAVDLTADSPTAWTAAA